MQRCWKYTYSAPNAPALRGPTAVPGQLDVFSAFASNQADPSTMTPAQLQAALPAAPGPADIPVAWKQSGRPRFQWDDSIGNIAYREVAASSTVTAGDPAAVNLPNVALAGNFTINLPPAPYPFDDVTSSRAVLFDTTEQGHANMGHTGAAFNGGINWKAEPRKLEDLLEYLKTL